MDNKNQITQPIVPVVDKGNAVIKKKPWTQKFKEAFIAQDFHQAADSVKTRVIIPAIKASIINAVNGLLTGLLYNNNTPPTGLNLFNNTANNLWSSWNGVTYAGQNINYSGMSKAPTTMSFVPSSVSSYQEIEIQPNPAKGESMEDAQRKANQVLETLVDQLTRYGKVPIGDLFDACGLVSQPTYFNYGWTSLQGASIQFTGTGFRFIMPNPVPLR